MGLFTWVKKSLGEKRKLSYASLEIRSPCFEQLEPRVLLSAEVPIPLVLPPTEPFFECAIVVDFEVGLGVDSVASDEWLGLPFTHKSSLIINRNPRA